MLKGLSEKLRGSIEKLTKSGATKEAVDEVVKDIQRALLESDVDVKLVFQMSENIRNNAFKDPPQGLTRKEYVIKLIYDELTKVLGEKKAVVELKPKKILLAGLFGSGKTTTSAKLGRFYQKKGLSIALVCCDTFRPAAFEQLQQLAEKIDVTFYGEKNEKNAAKVVKNALKKVKADVIIVDSSGRDALDAELVREIKEISKELNPDEKILVVPADIGQAAKQQAKAFHDALNITDIIVTKMDATAKGGGALAAAYETSAKVKFITVGETPDDLQQYDPEKFVARLLGFPDLESLLEKAKEVGVDKDKAEKMMKGDFDLEDFYEQIENVGKMGTFSSMLDMMGLGKMAKGDVDSQQEKMKKWKYVIQSMTTEEKRSPDLLNSSRIRRIANGSGSKESDVRELISNYNKMKKMMKMMSPEKLKRGQMAKLMKQFGMKM